MPHRQIRRWKEYYSKNKIFFYITNWYISTKFALLWNIAKKQGNFYRQTHNVNFHNVYKISAILWWKLRNTFVKWLRIGWNTYTIMKDTVWLSFSLALLSSVELSLNNSDTRNRRYYRWCVTTEPISEWSFSPWMRFYLIIYLTNRIY